MKKAAGKEGGEERVVSDRDGGLKVSSQVDEYEHDTSDEEVRICSSSAVQDKNNHLKKPLSDLV